MSKRDKRLKDFKSFSAAARAGFGTTSRITKKLKREQRKKLRLANKDIVPKND